MVTWYLVAFGTAIVGLTVAGVLSGKRWIQCLTVAGLVALSVVFNLAFEPTVRGVVRIRVDSGEWTPDYSKGAVDYLHALLVPRLFMMLAAIGLAAIALAAIRRGPAASETARGRAG